MNDLWCTPVEALYELKDEWDFHNVVDVCYTDNKNYIKEIFNAETPSCDFFGPFNYKGYYIVTNPPFSKKNEFMKECFRLYGEGYITGFALLLPLQGLQTKIRGDLYAHYKSDIKLRIFKKRIKFIENDVQSRNCPFGSFWLVVNKSDKEVLDWYEGDY